MKTRIGGKDYPAESGQIMVSPAGVSSSRSAPAPTFYAYVTLADTEQWNRFKEAAPYARTYESAGLFYLLIRGILDAKNTTSESDQLLAMDHAVSLLRLLKYETRRAGRSNHLPVRMRYERDLGINVPEPSE